MSAQQVAWTNASQEGFGRQRRIVLAVLCGAVFLDSLDVSMIGVALPSIQGDVGMSTGSLQWVVSAYVLGYGGFLLLGGRAADLMGRRRQFLGALAVFVVTSAVAGLAISGSVLIAARFVTGMSAAFSVPAGMSIITTSFPDGPMRNKALGLYAATGGVGFSLGLVFSGLLTEIDWRMVFLVPAAVATVTQIVGHRVLPQDVRPVGARHRFDLAGAITLTGSMLLLVYTIVEAPTAGWASLRTIAGFAAVVALLTLFVMLEQRREHPLVRLGILRSWPLVRAHLAAMTLIGAWFGLQFIATLYLQQPRGWSPLETGLAVFPGGVLVTVVAPAIPSLIERFGVTRLITAGLVCAAIAYPLFLRVDLDSSYAVAILPTMLLAGFAFALAYGPLNVAATTGIAAH